MIELNEFLGLLASILGWAVLCSFLAWVTLAFAVATFCQLLQLLVGRRAARARARRSTTPDTRAPTLCG